MATQHQPADSASGDTTVYATTVYHRGGGDGRRYHKTEDCRALGVVDDEKIRHFDEAEAEHFMDACRQPECYGDEPDQRQEAEPCPMCGEDVKDLPAHLRRHCDGGLA